MLEEGELVHKSLKVLAVLSTLGILIVVLAGAVVTKTGSGDGCGANWPLCHGQLIPEDPTIETVIEYTHRLITMVVGILIFIFSIWTGLKFKQHKEVVGVAILSLFFLLLQSALGALTLYYDHSSMIMALHFGFSLVAFATVFLLMVYVFQLSKGQHLPVSQVSNKSKYFLLSLFVYSYIVVYLGAFVRHTGSGMGCQDWPLCNGKIIPPLSGITGVQFMHRVAALLLLVAFITWLIIVYKRFSNDRLMLYGSMSLSALVFIQIISGGVVVLTNMDIIASLLHAFIICWLFAVLSYLLLYSYRKHPK